MMTEAQFLRDEFSQRLTSALKNAHVQVRPALLAREFNLRVQDGSGGVTSHAARKWLVGEAIPTQAKINVLAKWLCVSPSWLRFGGDVVTPPLPSTDDQLLLNDVACLDDASRALVRHFVNILLAARRRGVPADPAALA